MEKIDPKAKPKIKIKPFLVGKILKTNDLRQTAERRASGRGNQNHRIAYAEGRVKPLARLLRCATALRVTAPHGCGSRRLVCPKGSLSARPHGPKQPDWDDPMGGLDCGLLDIYSFQAGFLEMKSRTP